MHEVRITIPDSELKGVASKHGVLEGDSVLISGNSLRELRDKVDALLVELSEHES